jgi:uncharacterized protein YdhG (YjbR/CyaY superfamily)
METQFKNIDEYISGFSGETATKLRQMREIIQKAAPGAKEVISYGMPAFRLNKVLVYFAAYKDHIGFYPTAGGIEAFKDEFSGFRWSKGAVQFPLNKPVPLDLIERIVRYRVAEDLLKKSR